jgi:hypothetical protein
MVAGWGVTLLKRTAPRAMLYLELGKVGTIRPPDRSVENEPFPTGLRVRSYTDEIDLRVPLLLVATFAAKADSRIPPSHTVVLFSSF